VCYGDGDTFALPLRLFLSYVVVKLRFFGRWSPASAVEVHPQPQTLAAISLGIVIFLSLTLQTQTTRYLTRAV